MIKSLESYGRASLNKTLQDYIFDLSSYNQIGYMQFKFAVDTGTEGNATIGNKRNGVYTIYLSTNTIRLAEQDSDYLAALLVLVGHEIAHKRYPDASGQLRKIQAATSNSMSACLLSMCHETFADIVGRDLFIESTLGRSYTDLSNVAISYGILCGYDGDKNALKRGYLPAETRAQLIIPEYSIVGAFRQIICKKFIDYYKVRLHLLPAIPNTDPRLGKVNESISEVLTILKQNGFFTGRVNLE